MGLQFLAVLEYLRPRLAIGERRLQVGEEFCAPAFVDQIDVGQGVVFEEHGGVHERHIKLLPAAGALAVIERG
jgi:hypothetical protein